MSSILLSRDELGRFLFPPAAEKEGLRRVLRLAVCFFVAGAFYKLTAQPIERAFFEAAGLPPWMMYLMGVGELSVAFLLIPRATTTLAALVGIATMIGAMASVIASGWFVLAGLPPITTAMLLYVGWARRDGLIVWLSPAARRDLGG